MILWNSIEWLAMNIQIYWSTPRCPPSWFHHLVPHQSRRGVSHMVSIYGQNVYSSHHLPAHPGVRHDASGQSLRHGATQYVWPEEHLRPGYVRRAEDGRGCVSTVGGVFVSRFLHILCMFSGFRSSLACWWRRQTGISTFITWIRRMEASASWFTSTGVFWWMWRMLEKCFLWGEMCGFKRNTIF